MVCAKEKCTGCFACYNICPKKAIKMEEDEFGFVYPKIDKELCINCDLCKKVCPSLNPIDKKNPKTAYAMWNNDNEIRENSTSGAAATTLYTHILEQGGVVYGADNINDKAFKFIRIDNISELHKLKGSKYVHCYIDDIYSKVKNDLKEEKKVLFIGTPCQVQGLKKYLQKDYSNLITIDLICHGVPSQKFLKEEIESLIGNKEINKVTFRDKSGFNFRLIKDDKIVYETLVSNSSYYMAFMKGTIYRENCYTCPYATKERVSDITIGDFWGIDNQKFSKEINKGISLILPMTEKGFNLINEIKDCIYLEERTLDEAINGNSQLRHPTSKNKKNEIFKKIYLKKGYNKAIRVAVRKQMVLSKIKNNVIKNSLLKKVYLKIKNKGK